MVYASARLQLPTRTAPFPANVRTSCGARFLVAFPKIARRLAFSSKGNCQTIDASSDLASKGPGRSQLSHGDARLASCFKSSAKRETIGPKSDNEARTRGNKRPENCSFIVKSIAGAQRRLLRERCDELTSIHECKVHRAGAQAPRDLSPKRPKRRSMQLRLPNAKRGIEDVGRSTCINRSPTLCQSGVRCWSPIFAS
jgi:hypothetical protein